MAKHTRLFIVATLLLAGFVTGIFFLLRKPSTARQQISPVGVGAIAPDSMLKDTDGREVSLSSFRETPVIAVFWASWCSLCKDELLQAIAAHDEFGKKAVVLGINRGEPSEQIKKSAEGLGAGSSLIMLWDNDDALYQALGGFAMPEVLFIDREGVLKEHVRGNIGFEELRRRAQSAFGL